jgi:hypothetical protein
MLLLVNTTAMQLGTCSTHFNDLIHVQIFSMHQVSGANIYSILSAPVGQTPFNFRSLLSVETFEYSFSTMVVTLQSRAFNSRGMINKIEPVV